MMVMTAAYELDRIDRRILAALQANGRLTNQALAEQVFLSPSACLARVRRLETNGVILGYHARLDPFAIDVGLVFYVEVTLKRHDNEALRRFEEWLRANAAIVEASHMTGAYDYLLKVVTADMVGMDGDC